MKTAIAIAASALLAGCAGGPYYAGYDTVPNAYATPGYSAPYYGSTYYGSTYYGAPYYSYYPGGVGGSIYYQDRHDRRDDGRDRRDWNHNDGRGSRDWNDNDRGRRDEPRPPRNSRPSREPVDTRHGEAGNEAGM
jgi:hypothetical protein